MDPSSRDCSTPRIFGTTRRSKNRYLNLAEKSIELPPGESGGRYPGSIDLKCPWPCICVGREKNMEIMWKGLRWIHGRQRWQAQNVTEKRKFSNFFSQFAIGFCLPLLSILHSGSLHLQGSLPVRFPGRFLAYQQGTFKPKSRHFPPVSMEDHEDFSGCPPKCTRHFLHQGTMSIKPRVTT